MSIRTERVARLVQRELADILNQEFRDHTHALVTVTGARMSPDLSLATVQVSVMGGEAEERQAVLRRIEDASPLLRKALAARIRHQVRSIPELRFFLDESQHRAEQIERLLDQIREEREARPDSREEDPPDEAGSHGTS